MDEKPLNNKVPKEFVDFFIKSGIKSGEIRKISGPISYNDKFGGDILEWVKNDIENGRFIEAYALTEQYIEGLMKKVFDDGDKNYWDKRAGRISIKAILFTLLSLDKIDKNYFRQYCKFKAIRNDLVHNAVFNFNKYGRLKNTKEVKKIPIEIITSTESFLKIMIIDYLASHNYNNGSEYKAKLIHLVDFKNKEYKRINGKGISELELANYLMQFLEPPK
jgi:hypothetical protein